MIKPKIFRNAIKFLLALTFFVPLLVFPSSFIFPFIVPKVIAFRILVLLMTGGFVMLLVSNWERYKPKFSWLHILIFLFFIAMTVSTIVGVDPYSSFWDNHERMLGLFTVAHYVLYYYIASQVLTSWKDWRNMFRVFLLAGNLVMIVALIQKFIDPEFVLNQGQANRVHSTLGNPIYVSGYGMFLMFVGALLFIKEKVTNSFWKYYALFSSALGFIGIFLGGTRGTFLGLVASIIVALLIYAFFQKGQKKLRWGLGVGIIAVVALLGSIFAFRDSSFVQNTTVIKRLASVDITEGSANTRIMAWGSAIEAWKEKPAFGWGHRNFYFAFNKHYNPKFLRHGYGETWFDNAHNIIVNMLATKGAVGTLLYLGIYVAAFFALWLAYRRDQISIHMFALSFAFMIGHLVHNVFVFEDPTSYLYFFFYLAFIDQMTRQSAEESQNYGKDISYGLAIATTAVVLIAIYTTNINPTKANMKSLDSLRAMQSANNPVQSVESTLSTPSPHIDAIRGDIAQTALKVIPKYAQSGRTDQARELFNIVYSEIEKNEKLHPRDIRVYFKKARLAQMGASLFNDQQYMKEAEKALEAALEYSPKRQQVQFMLANLYVKLGQTDNAEELFKQAIQGDHTIGESWWRLAMFYRQVGNNKKAIETVQTAREKGVEFNGRGKKVISQIMSATSSKKTTSTVEK